MDAEVELYAALAAITAVFFYIMAVVSAVEAILKARTAQGAIAWVISLFTFPFATVPLYLIFGRSKFDGYLEQRDAIEKVSQELLDRASDTVREHIVPRSPDAPVYTSLFNLSRIPATTGNKVELLIDGEATFDSIFAGIASARHYVMVQFYIIRTDDLGRRLVRALANKAREGVRVYLLYDEIGSRRFPRSRLYKQLQMTGVQVAPFNTTQGRRNRFQLNFRNHRKVVVVDGEQAWIGGHNVGNEYLGKKRRVGHWRDTHARLEGPAVLGAVLAFATDWHWATRALLDIDLDFAGLKSGDSTVMVFPSDPASDYEEAGLMYHQIIVAAQKRIWIASPYFVPDRSIISALQLAALRGVDVRVVIPDEPDGPVVAMANWSFTKELLPVGVKIYRYKGGFMHQKVFLMDDTMAGVGTANFDNRSFRLNFEITMLVGGQEFAQQVETMLETDMARSRNVSLDEVNAKPMWFHLAMGAARLMSPVL